MIAAELPWARIERLFADWTGIDLHRGGTHAMLGHFIRERVQALGLASFDVYLELVRAAANGERQRLIDAATVGLTWFFRDEEQLRAMSGQLLDATDGMSQVWVAGCASGEDVYSLAMIAEEVARPATIFGTDINSELLSRAAAGRYGAWTLRMLPSQYGHWLRADGAGRHEVVPRLRQNVRFMRHNLLDEPLLPPQGTSWDLILCRNVLIYFELAKAAETISRLARALAPDGLLLLGASEMTALALPHDTAATTLGGRHALRRRRADEPCPRSPAHDASPLVAPVAPLAVVRPRAVQAASTPHRAAPATPHALAHDRLMAGRFDEAIERYRAILTEDPLSTEALMFLGIALHRSGRVEEAVHALRGALFLDDELWPAAFYLGVCHEKLGQITDAAREYRRVVECADRPLSLSPTVVGELAAWQSEVVAVARDYLYRRRSGG